MFKNRSFLPWLIALAAVVALILFVIGNPQAGAGAADTGETAVVTRLELAESVEASGELDADQLAALTWKTSGTVDQVLVQIGDFVATGDTLLTLDISTVPASLVSAQADLVNAQNRLDALTNPDGAAQAAAQKSLADAYAGVDIARASLLKDLAASRSDGDADLYADLTAAADALDDALDAYPLATDFDAQLLYWAAYQQASVPTASLDFASLTGAFSDRLDSSTVDLVNATLEAQSTFESALTDYLASLTSHARALSAEKAAALYRQSHETLLAATQSAYETFESPDPDDLQIAQASLAAAQANVNNLSITAPFSGEILSINTKAGAVVNSGTLAIVIADRSQYTVEVLIDESDIARVTLGNQAEVTLDALPDLTLSGVVSQINPVGELVSGLVKYPVEIYLDSLDQLLPLNTTANVTIQIGSPSSWLAVPFSAIQNDSQGEYVWLLTASGTPQQVLVESGSLVGSLVAVKGNLQEGDRIQIVYDSSVNMPNPFGGQ